MRDPLLAPYGQPPLDEDEELLRQQDPMYWLKMLADASSAGEGATPQEAAGPRLI